MPDPGAHEQAGQEHVQQPSFEMPESSTGIEIDPGGGDDTTEEEDEFVAGQIDYGGSSGGDFMLQVQQESRRIVGQWAKAAGYSANAGQAFVNSYWDAFEDYAGGALGSFARYGAGNMDTFQVVLDMALGYFGARVPFSVDPGGSAGRGSGGRGGGGGRGAAGPTPDEIRAQFDVQELANRANDIWFNGVLDDAPNARGMARTYVEEIVKNPEQRLDFDTWVRSRMEDTERYKTIYRRKPDGLPHEQFLMPLYQAALQAAGPEQAQRIAIGSARFGGDQASLQARLATRADVARNQAPFMRRIEGGMTALNSILKG